MSKSEGPAWLTNFAPAIYALAAAQAAAGLYLIDPTVADLGFALSPEHTALVGGFLLYAGFVLAFNTARSDVSTGSVIADLALTFLVGRIALFAVGPIEVAIGGKALFVAPANAWAALLLVPGLVSSIIAFSEEKKVEKKPDPATESDDPTTSDDGKIDARGQHSS